MTKALKITFIAGARPNFMKVAPILRALAASAGGGAFPVSARLVHTGQHYDANMSDVFFQELQIPEPDWNLGAGSGSHAQQTAMIMAEFEKVLLQERADLVVVVGDVNSTIACALTAKKMGIRVAHVEAGLRSFDEAMPEEINRRLTDAISDLLFVTEKAGMENLRREGVCEERVHFVGNVMIDALLHAVDGLDAGRIKPLDSTAALADSLGKFGLLTLHRPSNVDDEGTLARVWGALVDVAGRIPIIFPVHPRTRERLVKMGLPEGRIRLIEPVGYVDMVHLVRGSRLVLTDSGGLQEETTVLGVPCITIRENTERPSTIEIGTNELAGTDPERILSLSAKALQGRWKKGSVPPLWDGRAAERIIRVILSEAFPETLEGAS